MASYYEVERALGKHPWKVTRRDQVVDSPYGISFCECAARYFDLESEARAAADRGNAKLILSNNLFTRKATAS